MTPTMLKRAGRKGWFARSALTTVMATVVATTLSAGAQAAERKFFGLYPLGDLTPVPLLSDEPKPYVIPPERPAMPIELGCKFLGRGNLEQGIELPTGMVLTPCFWVFGTSRTAWQTYESIGPVGRNTEVVTRLDLFANLSLTSTEKCIIGVAPFDKNRFTNFTRYSFESNQGEEGGRSEAGVYVRTFFCEGDFGSVFPNLDPRGTKFIDYGFSFGRQQINFQEGIMINDFLDGIGIVRNNMHIPGFSNIRATGFYGWNSIDRGGPPRGFA